jgi:hypothetical protein
VKDPKEIKVGDQVVYVEADASPRNALVTAVWTPPMVNVVFVSGDENRTDSCGRQIERATSVYHKSQSNVHGRYWRYEHEEPNVYTPPTDV